MAITILGNTKKVDPAGDQELNRHRPKEERLHLNLNPRKEIAVMKAILLTKGERVDEVVRGRNHRSNQLVKEVDDLFLRIGRASGKLNHLLVRNRKLTVGHETERMINVARKRIDDQTLKPKAQKVGEEKILSERKMKRRNPR